jgi:putative Mg2+ transporter-C (MgtC) family protein
MLNLLPYLDKTLEATAASTVGTVLLRLIVAAGLGGAIGVEREIMRRPAGLRTNMFMCFGSALFTILSALLAGSGQDQTRIAAQVIAGIGFIGAGSILHSRGGVQGITTAATIFVVAAIGMCAGSGLMFPAAMATVIVVSGLIMLGYLERHVFVRPHSAVYQAEAPTSDELYSLLEDARLDKGCKLMDVSLVRQGGATQLAFTLEAQPGTHTKLRAKLREEFDTHKIISFSSSEQE